MQNDKANRIHARILPGHQFHKMTDAALRYVLKDAGEAAVAMRDHNPQAEAKYLDQVNDAATILRARRYQAILASLPLVSQVRPFEGEKARTADGSIVVYRTGEWVSW